jgi:phospholipase A1
MQTSKLQGPASLSALGLLLVTHLGVSTWAVADAADGQLDTACVMQMAESAVASTTLAEIRERCAITVQRAEEQVKAGPDEAVEPVQQPVEKRLAMDRESAARPFTIMAHKPNYFLVGAWNSKGWDDELYQKQSGLPEYENDDIESQFQISLKAPLAIGLFNDRMDLYGAYTNRSFWQMYNDEWSRPFRETNHEPEVWAQFRNDWNVWGFTNAVNAVGLVHQSNGRAGVLSRSWNRLYATFVFERGDWVLSLKPWYWLKKDREDSDNPDITDYMGHGELRLAWGKNGHVLSLMSRNQLESGFDEGAVEIGWSFPVFDYPYLRGYVQYFNGYGESLIDYNNKVNRIGIGISLTDWLD